MANVLEQELFHYFTLLNEKEKKSFLQMIKKNFKTDKVNGKVPTIEEYTKELEQPDAEIAVGDFILHEDVLKYFSEK
ncbi:MAG: hypothetical protein ABIS01_02590 [Ferruginibacter sp.]